MANKHKVSPERFRHLSKLIQISFKTKDWNSLQRHDMKLRELLAKHKSQLQDPQLAPEIESLKAIHKEAFLALEQAMKELGEDLSTAEANNERAKAYELTVTMEY
ncbi:LafD [Vibrio sp. J1-1]|uniref:LafD n=1 Tax=Vibrio sp. J1-1 TaxID=2912251 RepID=UPI001F18FC17|nr:LafD [Vibrio sp. J1-1]MCF7480401.1 LafD [Vibrio sp. J1-1]